ncbi:hypothetical protein ACQP0U_21640 [Micromonospora sp. CA-269861]|uniref:hypothetical protein n=1 Tax=Micromonospora sp. CA-269861 TaxID=3239968 RepID=UPI003D89F591
MDGEFLDALRGEVVAHPLDDLPRIVTTVDLTQAAFDEARHGGASALSNRLIVAIDLFCLQSA